ncbi:hypothetical protein D3C81_1632560 [compost metagenome]
MRITFAIAAQRAENLYQIFDQARSESSREIVTLVIPEFIWPPVLLPNVWVISKVWTKIVRAFGTMDRGHSDILGGRSPRRAVGVAARSYAAQIGQCHCTKGDVAID